MVGVADETLDRSQPDSVDVCLVVALVSLAGVGGQPAHAGDPGGGGPAPRFQYVFY